MRRPLFLAAPLLLSALSLQAAIATWTGGPSGTATDFSTSANWTPGVPKPGDSALFSLPTAGQPVLDAAASLAGLDFASPEGGWTLSGAGTLTLGAAGLNASGQTAGVNTVNLATLILGSGATTTWTIFDSAVAPTASTLQVCSAIHLNPKGQLLLKIQRPGSGGLGTLKLTGPISGTTSGGLRFLGIGGLKKNCFVLAGNHSSYEGRTVLSQATVVFDALDNAGSSSSFGNDGTVTLGDNNSFAAATYVGPGGATDRPWLLGGAGGGSINNNGTGPIAFNNTASAIGGSGNRKLQLGGTNTAENIFAELLADVDGVTAVIKAEAGTWTLANPANSYTGPTTLNGGILQVSKLALGGEPSCLGAATNAPSHLVLNNTATLTYTGAGDTSDRLFQMAGTVTLNNNGTGPLTLSNPGKIALAGGGAPTLTLGGSFAGVNTFGPSLGDNGATATSLTKRGPTTWVLTGANLYSGATTVRGGALLINGSLGTGPVLVGPGATLGGNGGTIAGAVTIQDGGILALGSAIGTLNLSDALSFSSASTNVMKVAKEGAKLSSDLLQGMSTLTFDGTLIVTATGSALAAGDSFQLFKAGAFNGAFAALHLPPLGSGLSWDTSALATHGTLRVAGPAGATIAAATAAPVSAALARSQDSAPPTARPVSLKAVTLATATSAGPVTRRNGAVVRGPLAKPQVAILFSCRGVSDVPDTLLNTLKAHQAKASFFVSSDFLQWPLNQLAVYKMLRGGHFVGPQSDSWTSLAKGSSRHESAGRYPEVAQHLGDLQRLGVPAQNLYYFLPQPEQANEAMAARARACGLTMLTGTPGTLSLETTTLEGKHGFVSSQAIVESVLTYERKDRNGLNGFLLLFPLDTDSRRKDQFSSRLGALLETLQQRGYEFVRVDQLVGAESAR